MIEITVHNLIAIAIGFLFLGLLGGMLLKKWFERKTGELNVPSNVVDAVDTAPNIPKSRQQRQYTKDMTRIENAEAAAAKIKKENERLRIWLYGEQIVDAGGE